MTPEQWQGQVPAGFVYLVREGDGTPVMIPRAHQHAAAALCLYGQPFGFTRAAVDLLRQAAMKLEADMDRWNLIETERPPGLRSLANRIEALLPPEP